MPAIYYAWTKKKNDQQMIDIRAAPKLLQSLPQFSHSPQPKGKLRFPGQNFGKVKNLLSALDKRHKLIDL